MLTTVWRGSTFRAPVYRIHAAAADHIRRVYVDDSKNPGTLWIAATTARRLSSRTARLARKRVRRHPHCKSSNSARRTPFCGLLLRRSSFRFARLVWMPFDEMIDLHDSFREFFTGVVSEPRFAALGSIHRVFPDSLRQSERRQSGRVRPRWKGARSTSLPHDFMTIASHVRCSLHSPGNVASRKENFRAEGPQLAVLAKLISTPKAIFAYIIEFASRL